MLKKIGLLLTCYLITGCFNLSKGINVERGIENTLKAKNYQAIINIDYDFETIKVEAIVDQKNKKVSLRRNNDYLEENSEHLMYIDYSDASFLKVYSNLGEEEEWIGRENLEYQANEINHTFDISNLLKVIKASEIIKKEKDYSIVDISKTKIKNILDYSVIFGESNAQSIEEVITKIYIEDNYIKEILMEISFINQNENLKQAKITYNLFSLNQNDNISIPQKVLSEFTDMGKVIEEAIFASLENEVIGFIESVNKEIVVAQLNDTFNLVVDNEEKVLTSNIKGNQNFDKIDLKFKEGSLNGELLIEGYLFKIENDEIVNYFLSP